MAFEIGLYTFGELVRDPVTGRTVSARQRLAEVVAAAQLADMAGLDLFAVGEHHRLDFSISATNVVLGALAQATSRIRLSSAVTVLSSSDPVRVFEDFSTIDLLSGGRAEIMAGRGAFIESFPLFGYRLEDYDGLFDEHLDLLLRLNESETMTWRGTFRPALDGVEISPRPVQERLPVWIAVGGTPQSVVRAGSRGLPMALGLIGGASARFAPLVDLYRRAGAEAKQPPEALRVGITAHAYVANTTQAAYDEFYPYYSAYLSEMSKSRGQRWSVSRADFEELASLPGVLFVGSPAQVVEKIMYQNEIFGHSRFIAQHDVGGLPYPKVASSIELLAGEVAPIVRRELAVAGEPVPGP